MSEEFAMTKAGHKTARACAALAIMAGAASATATPASALASRSSAFHVYHDRDGRAYVIGNNNETDTKIYIDGMDGVRDIGDGTVILPFNNGSRY